MLMNFEIKPYDLEVRETCFCGSTEVVEICSVEIDNNVIFGTAFCETCSLIFRNISPKLNWLVDAWDKRNEVQKETQFKFLNEDIEQDRYSRYLKFAEVLQTLKTTGRVLDIGCGTGFGMKALSDLGYEVSGIEPDVTRASIGIEKHNLNIKVDTIETFVGSEDSKFDIVTLSHSLEHMQNPYQTIEILDKVVDANGIIYIEVPDFRHFVQDWNDALYLGHITNFTKQSLFFLMECFQYTAIASHEASPEKDDGPYLAFFFSKNSQLRKESRSNLNQLSARTVREKYINNVTNVGKSNKLIFSVPRFNDLSLIFKRNAIVKSSVKLNIQQRKANYNKLLDKIIIS